VIPILADADHSDLTVAVYIVLIVVFLVLVIKCAGER